MEQEANGSLQDPVAACWLAVKEGHAHPDDWFPRSGPLTRANLNALDICTSCPVQRDCLTWSMKHSYADYSLYGIWGGSLPKERRRQMRSAA